MGSPVAPGDDVMVTVGGRRITMQSVIQLLEGLRDMTTTAGGGELLLRFFADRPETIAIPYPRPGVPLHGMSHVPAAGMVISVYHPADQPDATFGAIAVAHNGADWMFVGKATGPLEVVPGILQHLPLMHLVMGNIAWGHRAPPGGCPSISEWLLRVSLNDVAAELDAHQLVDGRETALLAEQLLRESFSDLITIVVHAREPASPLPSISPRWSELSASLAHLSRLDWDDLNAETFAEALGHHPDLGAWWSSRGIAGLELVDLPEVAEALERIKRDRPLVASLLRRAVDAFAQRFAEVGAAVDSRLRSRWRADDPELLLRLVRKTLADPDFPLGETLIGYRRRSGRLHQVARVDNTAGSPTLDLMSVQSVGPADGVLLIAKSDGGWTAVALNREDEHGFAASCLPGDRREFLTPIIEDELLAMLRRILTGRAQADPGCTPHEWAARRVLYGLARTLETQKFDGADGPDTDAVADAPADDAAKPEGVRVPLPQLIDMMLSALVTRHIGTLVEALGFRDHLPVVPTEPLPDELRWEVFAAVLKHLRRLDWFHFRVAPLAEAWAVPADQAEWWGADGLALLQARAIPDATESLLRCTFALKPGPESASAIVHLVGRIKQVFGDDIAVRWSFLSDVGEV